MENLWEMNDEIETLKDSDNNEYLYHITDKNNLEKIMKDGLDPTSKKVTINEQNLIYLTSDYNFIIENDDEFWRNNLVLLKVIINGIKDNLEPDYEYDVGLDINGNPHPIKAVTYDKKIDSKRISIIGELELYPLENVPFPMYHGKIKNKGDM
ncbi:hypothetical protein INTERNEXUS_263 [Bacillus phage vB_BspM_Internexus]|nr:hypothetical protein INTERNEXUS_263 [Bacillus phage vB_BspM_Internexus]